MPEKVVNEDKAGDAEEGVTGVTEEGAQEANDDLDPEELELQQALAAQAEEEAKAKQEGNTEVPEGPTPEGTDADTQGDEPGKETREETRTVPVAVLQKIRAENRGLREEVAYLRGRTEAMQVPENPDDPGGKQEPTPEERLAALKAEREQWSEKFDDGEISAVELERKRNELLEQEFQIREGMMLSRIETKTQTVQDLGLEQHLADLEGKYPIIRELNEDQLQPLKVLAIHQAEMEGNPIPPGALGTMQLRERMAKLAQGVYGTGETPDTTESSATEETGKTGLSDAAKAREQKLKQAANHPADVANMGTSPEPGAISEEEALARINAMTTEEEVEDFLKANPSLVNRVLGAA